jgi:hypothetical protein
LRNGSGGGKAVYLTSPQNASNGNNLICFRQILQLCPFGVLQASAHRAIHPKAAQPLCQVGGASLGKASAIASGLRGSLFERLVNSGRWIVGTCLSKVNWRKRMWRRIELIIYRVELPHPRREPGHWMDRLISSADCLMAIFFSA